MLPAKYIPLWTLFIKEVMRFLKVGMQTVLGPAISSLLFLAVFSLALGRSIETINGVKFVNFIAPGLIMMTILQNAFANAASSIGQSKFQGNIVDILMSPLSDLEITMGYIGGAILRGLICGIVTFIFIIFFISISIHSYLALVYYALMGSIMMGSLGTMIGIWADKWDQQQGITNFIVLPLTFLSGTFYSISRLPEFWKNFTAFNPFFYNIDGFRYAFVGKSDSSLMIGGISLLILNIILIYLCYLMFRSGYKLKS
jgi:ABC-2 type transport system permease protein